MVIRRYSLPHEAHIAQASLANAGIPSFIFDEHTVGMNWFYSNAIGGVRLMVAEEDLDEADKILATDFSSELEEALAVKLEAISCVSCGSHDIALSTQKRRLIFLTILLFNFPLFFSKKGFKCNSCGHFWQSHKKDSETTF